MGDLLEKGLGRFGGDLPLLAHTEERIQNAVCRGWILTADEQL
jgi:hypothetical protein